MTRFFSHKITQDSEEQYHTTNDAMTYRFTRLPFGLACSPFLLSTAVMDHADRHKVTFPTAAPLIGSNTFMVDFAAGAENYDAITIYYELTAIMKVINFPLAKWASNSDQLKAIWRAEGQDIEAKAKVLGVNWNTETDCFFFGPEAVRGFQKVLLPSGGSCKPRLGSTIHWAYTLVSVVGKRIPRHLV